ncbi:MAG: ABC transporter substrate-binding protein [Proteobacteria bacterium]|nr:ABC transporter substrate-binding protein [Pseudomonadota bacterium]
MSLRNIVAAAAAVVMLPILSANAEDVFKIGMSAGLTGYVAGADRAWRDGAQLAVEYLNKKGGIGGRKIQLLVEDNKSEPQEAVTIYRRMLSDDKVNAFASGCLSAGNIAAAPMLVRAQVPMVICSLLPTSAKELQWSYTILPPAKYDIEKQYEYLKSVGVTKVGILHDPSPYVLQELKDGKEAASRYGMTIVGTESYRADDADLKVQINNLAKAGSEAIIKLGLGGTVITAAKNIRDLGLNVRYSVMTQDMSLFPQVADVMGEKFSFVAIPTEVFEELPAGKMRDAVAEFNPLWNAKFKGRDPGYGGRGWDAVMLIAEGAKRGKGVNGEAVRDGLNMIDHYDGTSGAYSYTGDNRYGVKQNPYYIGVIAGGKVKIVK